LKALLILDHMVIWDGGLVHEITVSKAFNRLSASRSRVFPIRAYDYVIFSPALKAAANIAERVSVVCAVSFVLSRVCSGPARDVAICVIPNPVHVFILSITCNCRTSSTCTIMVKAVVLGASGNPLPFIDSSSVHLSHRSSRWNWPTFGASAQIEPARR
jgi:hypothetical protein